MTTLTTDSDNKKVKFKEPKTPAALLGQMHKIIDYAKHIVENVERSDSNSEILAEMKSLQQLSKGVSLPGRNVNVVLRPFHTNLYKHLGGIYAQLAMDVRERIPSAEIVRMSGSGYDISPDEMEMFGGGETGEIDPLDYSISIPGIKDAQPITTANTFMHGYSDIDEPTMSGAGLPKLPRRRTRQHRPRIYGGGKKKSSANYPRENDEFRSAVDEFNKTFDMPFV